MSDLELLGIVSIIGIFLVIGDLFVPAPYKGTPGISSN